MGDRKGSKVLTRRQRDAIEDAICKIVGAGGGRDFPREGSGTLVEYAGYIGVLTTNVLIPDAAAAAESTVLFHVTGIGEVSVSVPQDAVVVSSPADNLNYTLAILPSCPPGLIPVPLHRGKDCGVQAGDSVQVMQRRGGDRDLCVGGVVSVQSPVVLHDATANGLAEGGAVFMGFDAVAVHGGANFGTRIPSTTSSRLMEALSCAPVSTHKHAAKSKGILVSAICDDIQTQLRSFKRGGADAADTGTQRDAVPKAEEAKALASDTAAESNAANQGSGFAARLSGGGMFSCGGKRKPGRGGGQNPTMRKTEDGTKEFGNGLAVEQPKRPSVSGHEDTGTRQQPSNTSPACHKEAPVLKVSQKARFGVGLLLQSWKPKGLTHALNVVSGTHSPVRVERVVPGGAADAAKPRIAAGDVLIAVDGIKVTSIEQAGGLLGGDEEDQVTLVFGRNGYEFHVVLVRSPSPGGHQPPVEPNKGCIERDWTATVLACPAGLEDELGYVHAQQGNGISEAPIAAAPVLPEGFQGKKTLDAGVWDSIKGIAAIAVGGKGAKIRSKYLSTEDAIALFRVVIAPKLHGVIAKQGASPGELSLELLDKARIGDASSVRILLARGADPNYTCAHQGWASATPLIQAASAGSIPTISALVKAGAQLDVSDDMSFTPLHRAAGSGHVGAVRELVEAGAGLNVLDCAGKTPAQLAACLGFSSVFLALESTPPSYTDLQKHAKALQEHMTQQEQSADARAEEKLEGGGRAG